MIESPQLYDVFVRWISRWLSSFKSFQHVLFLAKLIPRCCLLKWLLVLYNDYPIMATCDFTLILILPKHDHKSRRKKKEVFFSLSAGRFVAGLKANSNSVNGSNLCEKDWKTLPGMRSSIYVLYSMSSCFSSWEWEDWGQARSRARELWIEMERPCGKHLAI